MFMARKFFLLAFPLLIASETVFAAGFLRCVREVWNGNLKLDLILRADDTWGLRERGLVQRKFFDANPDTRDLVRIFDKADSARSTTDRGMTESVAFTFERYRFGGLTFSRSMVSPSTTIFLEFATDEAFDRRAGLFHLIKSAIGQSAIGLKAERIEVDQFSSPSSSETMEKWKTKGAGVDVKTSVSEISYKVTITGSNKIGNGVIRSVLKAFNKELSPDKRKFWYKAPDLQSAKVHESPTALSFPDSRLIEYQEQNK